MIEKNPTETTTKELQSKILQLLDWTEEEFSHFMFETGLAYLQAYFGTDIQAIDIVKTRKEFWTWFKNQWYYRDQSFVETFDCSESPESLTLHLYYSLHNPTILACDIYPTRQVLGCNFPYIKTPLSC